MAGGTEMCWCQYVLPLFKNNHGYHAVFSMVGSTPPAGARGIGGQVEPGKDFNE